MTKTTLNTTSAIIAVEPKAPKAKMAKKFVDFYLVTVRCTVTGGTYIGARRENAEAFRRRVMADIKANRTHAPIVESVREHGDHMHTWTEKGPFPTKDEARAAQAEKIERLAVRGKSLSAQLPRFDDNMDFAWDRERNLAAIQASNYTRND